ncbi:MAG: WbqC family protein [Rhodothermales bacterium]
MSIVVILQSNYLPWRGYFDLIRRADHFVFYDTAQFTKGDWRNRNRIMGRNGPIWLTLPTVTSSKFGQSIAETRISDKRWSKRHLGTLQAELGRSPFFREHLVQRLVQWYDTAGDMELLSEVNRFFIEGLMSILQIDTVLHSAADIPCSGDRTGRLVSICQHLEASRYLTGPAAQNYLDIDQFQKAGIAVDWMSYPNYPSYPQAGDGFHPRMSIIEAIAKLPARGLFE